MHAILLVALLAADTKTFSTAGLEVDLPASWGTVNSSHQSIVRHIRSPDGATNVTIEAYPGVVQWRVDYSRPQSANERDMLRSCSFELLIPPGTQFSVRHDMTLAGAAASLLEYEGGAMVCFFNNRVFTVLRAVGPGARDTLLPIAGSARFVDAHRFNAMPWLLGIGAVAIVGAALLIMKHRAKTPAARSLSQASRR